MDELWARSRAGSHAGRGFHYQDAVATELALLAWRGELDVLRIIPEGLEDVTLEFAEHALHLQAKSRRAHRGGFSDGELTGVWRHLAERLAADPTAHVGLVLERPFAGVDTGFDQTLSECASAELRKSVAAAVSGLVDAGTFLARSHVLVVPAEQTTSVELLAERLGIAPASCMAHYAILRTRLAELADDNGVRAASEPAALTVAGVARLLDDVSESVDPSALEEAVRSGACALADFATAIADDRFYSGVDVVAGHVVAGLPLPRPELSDSLRDGLFERRVALAVGPSGAGKSALIWLAAYETRHLVRWYRVNRLGRDDVAALLRLVRGMKPLGAVVGFVIDDLGRDNRVGFDAFVEGLRAEPGALVLGACRQEDIFLVRTAYDAHQVHPELEPRLAERIWRELRATGATTWAEWREPYERSRGLLLEYGHLLTEGERLEETVAAQIARRVEERRAVELEVLALVATADAYGADLDAGKILALLGVDAVEMRAALERLVAEHLVSERDGRLAGLHELRSRYIAGEIHRLPPHTVASSVRQVIDLLEPQLVQGFLTRLLLEQSDADDNVIDTLASRLARGADPLVLAAAMQALRVVAFRRNAATWRSVFDEEGASPTNAELITYFVISGTDYSIFPVETQRTIERLRGLDYPDLRTALLSRIDGIVPRALANATDVGAAAAALTALAEVASPLDVDADALARLGDGEPLADLRLLLEAADAADPALAAALAESLGGSAALLARLESEQPWLRNARLDVDDAGRTIAAAEYAYVAEAHQPDAHEAVVELARYLAALAPTAAVAVCRAVDATGDTAGLGGVALADKAIDRSGLPTRAEVSWNRARARAAVAAVAAASETEHELGSRAIVVGAAQVVRRAGDAWVRGAPSSSALYDDALALVELSHGLRPRPPEIELAGPLDEGESTLVDPASFLGTMICNQLFVGLFQRDRVAPLIPTLLEQLDELAAPASWRLLDVPPLADLAALRDALLDVFAVASEHQHGDRVSGVALANSGKRGLAATARVARQRAAVRMNSVAERLESALRDAGFAAQVLRREGQPEAHRWPSDDFLVLVNVPSIFDWQLKLEPLVELCRPFLEDRVGFFIAPVRDASVVGSYGVTVFENAFPTEEVRDWPGLPLPLLDEILYRECGVGLAALVEVSGVIASVRSSEVHDDEAAVVDVGMSRATETLRYLEGLAAKTNDPLIAELGHAFLDLAQRVEAEAGALAQGKPVDRGVAASIVHGLKGDADDVFPIYIDILACCIEWDIEPGEAWARFQAALAANPS
jgi:hypothetical protein